MINKLFFILSFVFIINILARPIHFPENANFIPSYPYISGCTWRLQADFIHDSRISFNPNDVQSGDLIFVIVDLIGDFFENFHPKIKHPYILLVHHFFGESDSPVPSIWAPFLDDPKLIAWFAYNPDIEHPKLHPLPLGIPNEYNTFGKKVVYDTCIPKLRSKIPTKLCYLNYSFHTPSQKEVKDERLFLYKKFKNEDFCTCLTKRISTQEYLKHISDHRFVFSPRGNGLDTFRTWETLLMKRFPIVKDSTLNSLYKDLPVVIINDWNEISKEFLEKKYNELAFKTDYKWEKLYMPYWIEKIKKIQKKYRI